MRPTLISPSHNIPVTLFASEANVIAAENAQYFWSYLHYLPDILPDIVTVAVSLVFRQCRLIEFYFQCFDVIG